jgi:hypothetical protein
MTLLGSQLGVPARIGKDPSRQDDQIRPKLSVVTCGRDITAVDDFVRG